MRYIMLALIIMCTSSIVMADNTFIKDCMKDYKLDSFETYNYSKAAACVQKYRTHEQEIEVAEMREVLKKKPWFRGCLLYTSPSPRDRQKSRMPSSA